MISRGQMSFQVSKSPQEVTNASKKEKAARRLRQEGEGSVQGVAQRIRKRSGSQMSQGRRGKLGESSKKRKRPVKKKLESGGIIAFGCGSVEEGRRKETNPY